MSAEEVDEYIRACDASQQPALENLRRSILAIVPEAEQGLAYGVPAFRIGGRAVAGFSAAKHHISYLPHSGDVLARFGDDELAGFDRSKGALRFTIDAQLPDELLRALIAARRAEADV